MADKYCYRICHHSKVRQNAAMESKKYKAAVSMTEMDSSEPRKCHHRKLPRISASKRQVLIIINLTFLNRYIRLNATRYGAAI